MMKPYAETSVCFSLSGLLNIILKAQYISATNSANKAKHHLGTIYESVNCREQIKRLPKHKTANKQ